MNQTQYNQYADVLSTGLLSLSALERIIRHDQCSGWNDSPDSLARIRVYEDCVNKTIPFKKMEDDPIDALYGVKWPLPLVFPQYINTKRSESIPPTTLLTFPLKIGIVVVTLIVATMVINRL